MRSHKPWLCAIAATAVACTPVYENLYSYDEGWRKATVIDVGRGDAIRAHATRDCREELPPEVAATRVFARVTYSNSRNRRTMIVIVEEGDAPGRGTTVFVNAIDCALALRLGAPA